jgi:hypothetical protein
MVTIAWLPVLWLCGAPATGKPTVAWQVFADLADQGLCVGYFDVDQIGMLQPPPDGDPACHRFKVDNLAGMVRNYRAAGDVTIVIGPRAVGESSVSWRLATRRWVSGEAHRVCRPGPGRVPSPRP